MTYSTLLFYLGPALCRLGIAIDSRSSLCTLAIVTVLNSRCPTALTHQRKCSLAFCCPWPLAMVVLIVVDLYGGLSIWACCSLVDLIVYELFRRNITLLSLLHVMECVVCRTFSMFQYLHVRATDVGGGDT